MMQTDDHPFSKLRPEFILNTIDAKGFSVDARILELNSYENRVYQIGLEGNDSLIAKFYRPNRWTIEQIQEEHDFLSELALNELSVVAPMIVDEASQFRSGEFNVALFEKRGGRTPSIENAASLETLGRTIAQIHNVGATKNFEHRPSINTNDYGISSKVWLLENHFIPPNLEKQYDQICTELTMLTEEKLKNFESEKIRIHADCHLGNILWREEHPHFVDFDDSRSGPAIQDLWMFLSGNEAEKSVQMAHVIRGYLVFRDFDFAELSLIECLRTLRIMRHSAWIGRRWSDPAFPRAFPFFNTEKYWSEHIGQLIEQRELIEAPSIVIQI